MIKSRYVIAASCNTLDRHDNVPPSHQGQHYCYKDVSLAALCVDSDFSCCMVKTRDPTCNKTKINNMEQGHAHTNMKTHRL